MAQARAWAGRLGLFAAGVGVHALLSWARPQSEPPPPTVVAASCPPVVDVACPEPPAVMPRPKAEPEPLAEASAPEVTPSEAPAAIRPPKPSLTLPRMPGTNQLRAGAKWDEGRDAWALTLAYEIPAARPQVTTFYRKVLDDAQLEVTSSEGPPDEEGAVPVFLKGRTSGQHAHVTIRQSVDEFETRVRIIWRFYAGGEP